MIDITNALPAAPATTQAAQSVLNASHVVALLVGGIALHVYHSVVNAGGYTTLWRKFKYGPTGNPPSASASPRLGGEESTSTQS